MGDAKIRFYYSSVTGNSNLRKHQQHVEDVLSARKIDFDKIDISAPDKEEDKMFMRKHSEAPGPGKTPLPPQLFSGEEYLGDYDKFVDSLENEELDVFLKLKTKTEVSQAEVTVTGGKSAD